MSATAFPVEKLSVASHWQSNSMPPLSLHTELVPKRESLPLHRGCVPAKLTRRTGSWWLYQHVFAQAVASYVLSPANSQSLALEISAALAGLFQGLCRGSLTWFSQPDAVFSSSFICNRYLPLLLLRPTYNYPHTSLKLPLCLQGCEVLDILLNREAIYT